MNLLAEVHDYGALEVGYSLGEDVIVGCAIVSWVTGYVFFLYT